MSNFSKFYYKKLISSFVIRIIKFNLTTVKKFPPHLLVKYLLINQTDGVFFLKISRQPIDQTF